MGTRHHGPIRSEWADIHVGPVTAMRLWEAIQTRTALVGHEDHADFAVITRPTTRYCQHTARGYTVKVRGCAHYRSIMLAAIQSEAVCMDVADYTQKGSR